MADTTSTVNGVVGAQYSQPAELAASTPSAPSHAPSGSQSTAASATVQKADATEIGWYFVEQYYTTLSKSPERIHLFYNKKSQMVTGNQAEKVIPAVGVKAICDKIKSLDIQDCKVRVLNVDSQASFNNIVVQVIGELSNKNQPHHKFVQTFVLAEQPNGYFVLNDIFRYLSDDEDEIVDDQVPQPPLSAEEPSTTAAPEVSEPFEPTVTTEAAAVVGDNDVEEVKEQATPAEPTKVETEPEVNEAPSAVEEVAEAPAQSAVTEAVAEQPVEETRAASETSEPAAAPAAEATAPEAPTPEVAAPEVPPAKKTWASMLGGNPTPAVPALPAKQVTPAQPQPKAARTATQAPQKSGPQAKTNDGNVLAYIKNVNEKVDARTLREVLERYGELKYFDVSRPRNCAFVEFATPEGYAAAVAGNPHTVNTETISVEERRPRPGAYGAAAEARAISPKMPAAVLLNSNVPSNPELSPREAVAKLKLPG
ncbi:hypothetical protein DV738_g2970, partial [Chaetothyriales sp. CBS 135597]